MVKKIVAVRSYYLERSLNREEVAFTVAKEYRNKGIGSFVVDKLLETYNEFEILDIKPSAIKFWKKWNVKIKRDFDYCFYSKISRL